MVATTRFRKQVDESGDLVTDFTKRQHARRQAFRCNGARHAPHDARPLVLHKHRATVCDDRARAIESILAHASEHNREKR